MKYNSVIYLTEQLKKIKGTNAYSVENYISYIESVIGNFSISPGSIKCDSDYYDLSFKPKVKSTDYAVNPMMCKAFTPFYDINAKIKSGYSEIRIKRNINGLLISIIYYGYRDDDYYGLYILEKNTIDSNQELHISFYDYATFSSLTHDYNISIQELKTYNPLKLYELGFLPDNEATVNLINLGLLNVDELKNNNIGDINNLITNRVLNTIRFDSLINRINSSFNRSKHI